MNISVSVCRRLAAQVELRVNIVPPATAKMARRARMAPMHNNFIIAARQRLKDAARIIIVTASRHSTVTKPERHVEKGTYDFHIYVRSTQTKFRGLSLKWARHAPLF